MLRRNSTYLFISMFWLLSCGSAEQHNELPGPAALPAMAELPDPLLMLDGMTRVQGSDDWTLRRRPELKRLFRHYVYGFSPDALPIRHHEVVVDDHAFDGAATISEVEIVVGEDNPATISLLLVTPNDREGPLPVILQLNKCGNQSVTDNSFVTISNSWASPIACNGPNDNRAHRAGRFQLEYVVKRGYAVATFHESDIDPDKPDFTDGVHALFSVGVEPDIKWGTIAAWSWGLSRVIDYFYESSVINTDRIVLFGHSRRGKTSLLTAAMDERVDLVVSHQSGTAGAAISRSYNGESVKQINDRFPHWFNDVFPLFNDREEHLPIDQHELLALVAPRSAFLTNGADDLWADPAGTLQTAMAASPVWKLFGEDGYDQLSPKHTNYDSSLAYFIRPGGHGVTLEDWEAITRYADSQFAN